MNKDIKKPLNEQLDEFNMNHYRSPTFVVYDPDDKRFYEISIRDEESRIPVRFPYVNMWELGPRDKDLFQIVKGCISSRIEDELLLSGDLIVDLTPGVNRPYVTSRREENSNGSAMWLGKLVKELKEVYNGKYG